MTTDWLFPAGIALIVIGIWYWRRGPQLPPRWFAVVLGVSVLVLMASIAAVVLVSVDPVKGPTSGPPVAPSRTPVPSPISAP